MTGLARLRVRVNRVGCVMSTISPLIPRSRTCADRLRRQPVTLLYAARDETRNNAVALKAWLERLN